MKKTAVDPALLHLLVSIYNQSIQTYFYFPEVILCGRQRLERQDFALLLELQFVQAYKADSFGRWYRLSRSGEEFLIQSLFRRRQRSAIRVVPAEQNRLPFYENC